MMPLLHTWSLGVEEQFYIVWPLLLFTCYRVGSRLAVSVLVVGLAVVSLAYSEWGTASKYAAQLFYLLQSRAWELMFGAILALGLVPRIANRWLRDWLGFVRRRLDSLCRNAVFVSHSLPRTVGHHSLPGGSARLSSRDSNATRRFIACLASSLSYSLGSYPIRSICGIGRSTLLPRTMSVGRSPSAKHSH